MWTMLHCEMPFVKCFFFPKLYLNHEWTTIIFWISMKMKREKKQQQQKTTCNHSKAKQATKWLLVDPELINHLPGLILLQHIISYGLLMHSGFDTRYHINHSALNATSLGTSPPSRRSGHWQCGSQVCSAGRHQPQRSTWCCASTSLASSSVGRAWKQEKIQASISQRADQTAGSGFIGSI